MIYILMFLLSLFFMWLGFTFKKNKIIKFLLITIGLLIPCLMAGFRGLSVGTDTNGYVLNLYKNAKSIDHFSGIISFSKRLYYSTDYIYLFITYIIGHNQLSFQLLLFIYEAFIILPIFISMYMNKKDDKDVLFGMFLFYMMFYNLSLNMIRQSIAISFTILAFFIVKNEKIKYKNILSLFVLLIGYGFHDTALFSILIMCLYLLFNNNRIKENNKKIMFSVIIFLCLLCVIFYKPVLSLISSLGIYSKADMYLHRYSSFDFNFLGTLRNVILLVIVLSFKKFYIENKENYIFILLITILNILIGLLGTFVTYADRISYYLYFTILFIYIPMLSPKTLKINPKLLIFIVFTVIYWFVVIFMNNSNETLPYVFFN